MYKECTVCGEVKNIVHFPVRGYRVDGSPSYRNLCTDCWRTAHNQHNRAYRQKHKEPEIVEIDVEDTSEVDEELLIKALAELARNSPALLDTISKADFINFTGYDGSFSFTDLKEKTFSYLDSIGAGNPSHTELAEDGTYLIIGDTYGMYTRSGMFDLLNNIIDYYNVRNVIVVGRQLDDNDNISNRFKDLRTNIIFIPTADELSKIHKLNESIGGSIYRDYVTIGDVTIRNQEQITPYVKKAISTLDPLIFRGNTIVNCSRLEYATRSGGHTVHFIASCGSLAEPHVPKVINKLLLTSGCQVKQVFHNSFKKYRKAEEDKALWQMGCILLSKQGHTTIPIIMPIKNVDGKYVTANNGTVFTSDGITENNPMEVVVADIHAPKYNKEVLSTVLNYLSDKSSTSTVDLYLAGDIMDSESVNPHILSRGELPNLSVTDDLLAYDSMLESFRGVLDPDAYVCVITGNHSDFINRWCKKNPQFRSLFESMLSSIEDNNNVCSMLVDDYTLSANDVVIIHGNTDIATQGSTNVEKLARSFGSAICGHSHSTNMRFGALRVGCLANRNQGYNSPYCSWDHSIGVITNYECEAFVSFMKVDSVSKKMSDGKNWWSYEGGDKHIISPDAIKVEVSNG